MIKVYEATEKVFSNNGLKILKPRKAVIHKEDNGDYYLELEDTIENLQFYKEGYIARVKSPWGFQNFRMTNPKIKNRKVNLKAWHVFYDAKQYVILDSNVVDKTCIDALDHVNSATDKTSPFTVISDVTTVCSTRVVRKTLAETVNIIREKWGGHLVRNNWSIEIRDKIGQDRGVTIAYSKNIKEIEAEEQWNEVVTKIYPVGYNGTMLPEKFLEAKDVKYDLPYTKIVEFTQEIEQDNYETDEAYEQALIADLRRKAQAYLDEHKFVKVNYSTSAHIPDKITDVGDIIRVKHPKCNIDILTEVISLEWDVIRETYKTIEFGNFRKNTLSNLKDNIETSVDEKINSSESFLNKELKKATAKIWGVLGNSYVIYEGDKILVVDKLPKEQAKNCMVITSGGIGFSTTGIKGPFNSAWTIDGTLDMQYINVLHLTASLINGGTLKLGKVDNNAGILELYNGNNKRIIELNKNGLHSYNEAGVLMSLLDENGQRFYRSGSFLGIIGTNQLADNANKKGILFGLECNDNAKYMCWGAKQTNTSSTYHSVLAYSRANGMYAEEGLYTGTSLHVGDKLEIGSGYDFSCYRNMNMNYYSIDNCLINSKNPITNRSGYNSIESLLFMYYTDGTSNNYGYVEFETTDYGNVRVTCWQSDGRMKKNIADTEVRALDVINKISHRQCDWKSSGAHEDIIYIAQELEKVKASFVMKVPQTDEDGKVIDEIYQINGEKIIPYLSKSIQELSEENTDLKNQLSEQQKQIDFLMSKLNLSEEYLTTKMTTTRKAIKKKKASKIKQYDEDIKIVKRDRQFKKVKKREEALRQKDIIF